MYSKKITLLYRTIMVSTVITFLIGTFILISTMLSPIMCSSNYHLDTNCGLNHDLQDKIYCNNGSSCLDVTTKVFGFAVTGVIIIILSLVSFCVSSVYYFKKASDNIQYHTIFNY